MVLAVMLHAAGGVTMATPALAGPCSAGSQAEDGGCNEVIIEKRVTLDENGEETSEGGDSDNAPDDADSPDPSEGDNNK